MFGLNLIDDLPFFTQLRGRPELTTVNFRELRGRPELTTVNFRFISYGTPATPSLADGI